MDLNDTGVVVKAIDPEDKVIVTEPVSTMEALVEELDVDADRPEILQTVPCPRVMQEKIVPTLYKIYLECQTIFTDVNIY